CSLLTTSIYAQPLKDFTFKSPAFNGNGYSAHVLTIENQEHSRKKAIADKIEAKLKEEEAAAENTNVKKFMSNLESRIYAQISQDVATAMFNDDGTSPTSGTLNFEGNIITWDKSSGDIVLGVTDMAGTTTTLTIPLGDFTF
ncbi:curli assembly protein CsgF, partial [Methylophilaceae bacterium]|nr:curli assembly protein CsgF [Methylophilaceae bacterium]